MTVQQLIGTASIQKMRGAVYSSRLTDNYCHYVKRRVAMAFHYSAAVSSQHLAVFGVQVLEIDELVFEQNVAYSTPLRS